MANIAGQHIFLVDDEPKVREVVGETLKEFGVEVTCLAGAADCLERLSSQRCDLLITDVRMPGMSGIDLLREAKRIAPWMPILLITGYGDIPMAVTALKAGAVDFIEKPLDREAFLRKVKSILQQSASIGSYLGKRLSKSEITVFKLVVKGMSNREIADLLNRSIRTVEVHRNHVMRKLGVDSPLDLLKRAAAMGLIELPPNKEQDEAT